MAASFALTIATPAATLFEGEATSLNVPAADGRLGVLAGHAPMVAELAIGEIVVTDSADVKVHLATAGGVLRVEATGVVVVSEASEVASAIDIERAQRALDRARQRLSLEESDSDVSRAELALGRALNRLRVGSQGRAS